ncbi:unnamed protein product [Spirodela intermedia]|uniref:Auxin-responsive protein n=1 Tax=Spirodela intermedia TaxID=51605 RepID=A0A7I8I7W3_SPIIN|nr:unnamed protein product [Spirodela intermedia]CAA6653685.1 unnamed protein product [Spirodela intermedia]
MASVETELRLGLPGGDGEAARSSGKRGYSEILDLKLKFTAADEEDSAGVTAAGEKMKNSPSQKSLIAAVAGVDTEKPPAPKAQVVGWPPVRSFRKNILSVQSEKGGAKEDKDKSGGGAPPSSVAAAAFVKVSMDGAPYLRKVDLKTYGSYAELSKALEEMFGSFTDGGSHLRDFMSERRKTTDLLKGSDYVPTYEDKDGDWMLVGDVPWDMFVNSCKRLRIMRGSEAVGLVSSEHCKNVYELIETLVPSNIYPTIIIKIPMLSCCRC